MIKKILQYPLGAGAVSAVATMALAAATTATVTATPEVVVVMLCGCAGHWEKEGEGGGGTMRPRGLLREGGGRRWCWCCVAMAKHSSLSYDSYEVNKGDAILL